jgi:hypothetical protein
MGQNQKLNKNRIQFLKQRYQANIPLVFTEKTSGSQVETIDKSAIKRINLMSNKSETRSSSELAEELCGALLQFFEANEIEKTPFGSYGFPYGEIIPISFRSS